jgi:hypothetical protein
MDLPPPRYTLRVGKLPGIEGRKERGMGLPKRGEGRVRDTELAVLLEIGRDLSPRGATAGKKENPPPFASGPPPAFRLARAFAGFVSGCFIEFSLFQNFFRFP